MMEKNRLRKRMKAIRDGLPPAYREAAARDCCRQLLLNDVYKNAKWVYTYISFGSELDTRALIGIMLDEGKHVAVPKIQGDRMEFYEIKSMADCRPGTWGIPEPEATPGSVPLNPGGPDTETPDAGSLLMLLPGLAFDREGNRLGYGGGYYDRYLADHPGFFCCGLAYREQVIESVPTDKHDVRTDNLISNDKKEKKNTMKNHYDYDVAVITAVSTETRSIKNCYDQWERIIIDNDDKTRYYATDFYSGSEKKRLVTCQQMHMGMTSCTLTCMKLIEHFRPRYLIMAGIAAGIRDDIQMYGDVIVPDTVWDYSTGKFVSKNKSEVHFGDIGFLPRPSFMQMDDDLAALIKELAESKDHEFKIHMGMMACGNSLVASENYVNNRVRSLMPQTLGLDMESYGVFYAARNCTKPRPKPLVIKSICDYADEEKSDQYQKFAAYTSSQFTKWLIENKLIFEG